MSPILFAKFIKNLAFLAQIVQKHGSLIKKFQKFLWQRVKVTVTVPFCTDVAKDQLFYKYLPVLSV